MANHPLKNLNDPSNDHYNYNHALASFGSAAMAANHPTILPAPHNNSLVDNALGYTQHKFAINDVVSNGVLHV